MKSIKVISPPTTEPISLDLARRHCRILPDNDSPASHPDDAWLTEIGIPAAREYCEGFLGRAIAAQTWEQALDAFPSGSITLVGSVSSVTSIKYIDTDGNEQTLSAADYVLDSYSVPAVVSLAVGVTWPLTLTGGVNTVKIVYPAAGYTLPGDSPNNDPLPTVVRAAILLMIGHLYENREATTSGGVGGTLPHELPLGVADLLRPHQLRMSMA